MNTRKVSRVRGENKYSFKKWPKMRRVLLSTSIKGLIEPGAAA